MGETELMIQIKQKQLVAKRIEEHGSIFCNRCKHSGNNPCFPYNDECYAEKQIKRTAYREYRVWGDPNVKNKNNDCIDFGLRVPVVGGLLNFFKGGH